jgi:hypothetical protein
MASNLFSGDRALVAEEFCWVVEAAISPGWDEHPETVGSAQELAVKIGALDRARLIHPIREPTRKLTPMAATIVSAPKNSAQPS